jgi:hypothetical protein
MRKLQRFSIAFTLTLMLCTSALAGIIDTPPAPVPPEPPSATATGIIGTPLSVEPIAPTPDPVIDVALDLMRSVLSLL